MSTIQRFRLAGLLFWIPGTVLCSCGSSAKRSSFVPDAGNEVAGASADGALVETVGATPDASGTSLDASDSPLDGGECILSTDSLMDAGIDAAALYVPVDACCFVWGALACSAENPKNALLCDRGIWKWRETCSAAQNCEIATGICVSIVPECQGRERGYGFCKGDTLRTCSFEGGSLSETVCPGVCRNGACVPPQCGDGKVESGEECDDGNTVAGDGCEPDCLGSAVLQLAAGFGHTCALLRGGHVRCWGGNDSGQLGLGTAQVLNTKKPFQLPLAGLGAKATALTAGEAHTCALMAAGSVQCWGRNSHGQLGLGHTLAIGDDELPTSGVAEVPLGKEAIAVTAGGDSTCALLQGGAVRCWGANESGQLGLGHTLTIGDDEVPSDAAATVTLGGQARAVGMGGRHACAIMVDNSVRCWGYNANGDLGLGTTDTIGDDELPTAVATVTPADDGYGQKDSLAVGLVRACVHYSTGYVRCWGYNGDGGLGVGYVSSAKKPVAIVPIRGAFDVVAGGFHICSRLTNHLLRCWGENQKGQLGLFSTETVGDDEAPGYPPPIDLGTSDDAGFPIVANAVAAGQFHTCALLNSGVVRCWGLNDVGQLGLGYVSAPPLDYVGGDTRHTPAQLDPVQVLPPNP